MAEPARHVRLISDHGELVGEACPDCITKDQEKTRLTRSYEGTIRTLKAQLAAEVEDDKAVRMVLTYFSRLAVETGWWKQTPKWSPGDERWTATAARLRSGRSVADCFVAIRGALEQDKRRTKRAYVDLTSVFRNNSNFERAFEHACDPGLDRVQTLQKRMRAVLPEPLRDRWREVEEAGDLCACGHIRWDHDKPRPLEGILDPPCVECGCEGFSLDFVDPVRWARGRMGQ